MSSEEELVTLFKSVGLADKKTTEVVKNKKVSHALSDILINDVQITNEPIEEKKLTLLHALASDIKGADAPIKHRALISRKIVSGDLKTNLQVTEGVKFVLAHQGDEKIDESKLNEACGVGIELSREEVKDQIRQFMESRKDDLLQQRYTAVPKLLGETKRIPQLKWALPNYFKPVIDELALEFFGPKDERDVIKKEKKKPAPATKAKQQTNKQEPEQERSMFSEGFLGELHKPGQNPQAYPELMKEHLATTHGEVWTRFPPEPNGYLHIGHSKAIMVNFGYAKFHNGKCYLRFDDTNPEAEEEVYFNSIKDMIDWLGFKPWKITYSSDYFDQLYELAEKLITEGKAYVCHCTPEEVKAQRGLKSDGTLGGERFASPHRDRSVEENLREFRRMKSGEYEEGKATLRMKQDITSPSPQMWDLVAYRVLKAHHHRTGDKWKIYPTYDFTHCLVDSFENISHSLCTTEFRLSRESYEWLCDQLHVYRPAQREYGRLNITGTVLSKRKIAKLVDQGIVRGWDDPRLYTLEAIRRRGVPPGAILSFINTLGVTTSTTNIQEMRFESAIRTFLDQTTPRLMMILEPVLVELENVDDSFTEVVEMPYKPGDDAKFGVRKLTFSKKFYIDADDYRDEFDKSYRRLAPGQPVGLMRVPFNISVVRVERDAAGKLKKVVARYDHNAETYKKPKTFIQWIGESDVLPIEETRIQNRLFKSENPAGHPDGYLADINPDSEEVVKGAIIEKSAFKDVEARSPLNVEIAGSEFNIKERGGPQTVRFQALRIGYFCIDKDSKGDQGLILNRIVTLKEDAAKN